MCHEVETYFGNIIVIDRNIFHNYWDIVRFQNGF
jgi:hypothetical protein